MTSLRRLNYRSALWQLFAADWWCRIDVYFSRALLFRRAGRPALSVSQKKEEHATPLLVPSVESKTETDIGMIGRIEVETPMACTAAAPPHAAAEWTEVRDSATGRVYYWNTVTNAVSWSQSGTTAVAVIAAAAARPLPTKAAAGVSSSRSSRHSQHRGGHFDTVTAADSNDVDSMREFDVHVTHCCGIICCVWAFVVHALIELGDDATATQTLLLFSYGALVPAMLMLHTLEHTSRAFLRERMLEHGIFVTAPAPQSSIVIVVAFILCAVVATFSIHEYNFNGLVFLGGQISMFWGHRNSVMSWQQPTASNIGSAESVTVRGAASVAHAFFERMRVGINAEQFVASLQQSCREGTKFCWVHVVRTVVEDSEEPGPGGCSCSFERKRDSFTPFGLGIAMSTLRRASTSIDKNFSGRVTAIVLLAAAVFSVSCCFAAVPTLIDNANYPYYWKIVYHKFTNSSFLVEMVQPCGNCTASAAAAEGSSSGGALSSDGSLSQPCWTGAAAAAAACPSLPLTLMFSVCGSVFVYSCVLGAIGIASRYPVPPRTPFREGREPLTQCCRSMACKNEPIRLTIHVWAPAL